MRLAKVIGVAVILSLVAPLEGCSSKDTSSAAAKKKKKGVTPKGGAAKTAGQKSGTAAANASSAKSEGAEQEGLTCDAQSEGVAWCSSDEQIVFCKEGTWYELDCGAAGLGVCAEDEDTHVVDCDPLDSVE